MFFWGGGMGCEWGYLGRKGVSYSRTRMVQMVASM